MNDIDIRDAYYVVVAAHLSDEDVELDDMEARSEAIEGLVDALVELHATFTQPNAAAMFDAIETGRQWETIARRLLGIFEGVQDDGWEFDPGETAVINEAAAFRDVADRTPDPTTHHDGGAE